MSTVKTNNVQIGQSATASNNFVLSVPDVPDGSLKISRGNVGATTQDLIVVGANNSISIPGNGAIVGATDTQTLTNKTLSNVLLNGAVTEDVYVLSGTILDPSNGTIQQKSITEDTTFTESIGNGQSLQLILSGVSNYIITFPTLTWISPSGNVAPSVLGNISVFVFWKVNSSLYAIYAGSGS